VKRKIINPAAIRTADDGSGITIGVERSYAKAPPEEPKEVNLIDK